MPAIATLVHLTLTLSALGIDGVEPPGAPVKLAGKQTMVRALACQASVPPALALAVIDEESGFDNSLRGSRGEIGASQILPSTAAALGFDLKRLATEFEYNAKAGVAILKRILTQSGGDHVQALSVYRAGPRWKSFAANRLSRVKRYVRSVEGLMATRYAGVECGQTQAE